MTSANRKTCTIVCSNKGGVGKSMISLMQTMIYDNASYPLRLIEIDNERKLSALLGDRVNYSIDAFVKISDASKDRFASESYYNGVYAEMTKADSLIDFGANVTNSFFDWFKDCEMGYFAAEDNIHFRVVACASPDEQAISAAITAIEKARDALGQTAEYFVVLNDIVGQSGFAPYYGNPHYLALHKMQEEGKVKILEVAYCSSLLFEHGKARQMTPLQIINEADELAKAVQLDAIATRVHKLKLMRWLSETQVALDPLLQVYVFEPNVAAE